MKKQRKRIKLNINPKNVETRVGTLATPEAFSPKAVSKRKLIKIMQEIFLQISRRNSENE